MGKIIIKQGDITKEDVDVVVNAANIRLGGGGGVDGAIHRAAGASLMDECRQIGCCKTGEAVITNAGNLLAKKIIHTPGPIWRGGNQREPELLKNCYDNSFSLAKRNGLKTIAFPSISTGVYGYPIKEAAGIALNAGKKHQNEFDEIRYICFSDTDYRVYMAISSQLLALS